MLAHSPKGPDEPAFDSRVPFGPRPVQKRALARQIIEFEHAAPGAEVAVAMVHGEGVELPKHFRHPARLLQIAFILGQAVKHGQPFHPRKITASVAVAVSAAAAVFGFAAVRTKLACGVDVVIAQPFGRRKQFGLVQLPRRCRQPDQQPRVAPQHRNRRAVVGQPQAQVHLRPEMAVAPLIIGDFGQRGIRLRLDVGFAGIEIDTVHGDVSGTADIATKRRGVHFDEIAFHGFGFDHVKVNPASLLPSRPLADVQAHIYIPRGPGQLGRKVPLAPSPTPVFIANGCPYHRTTGAAVVINAVE